MGMLILFFAVLLAPVYASDQLTPAQILQKVSDTYRNPQRYYFAAKYADADDMEGEVILACQRPDKFRMEASGSIAGMAAGMSSRARLYSKADTAGDHDVMIVDGESTWLYFPGTKKYDRVQGGFVHEDPDDLDSPVKAGSAPAFASHGCDMALARFQSFVQAADRATLLRTEALPASGKKVACYVLRINVDRELKPSSGSYYTWWVDKNRFVVLKEDFKSTESASTTEYTRVSLDEPLDPTLFAFTPPPGASRLETPRAPKR